MSLRYQAGINLPGYNPLKVANAPTIGTATAGTGACASVTFTAPSCVGGGAISSYTVFSNCGAKLASGASSPLLVTGLTVASSYTFKVVATNTYGPSYPSAASNSVTATVVTCTTYTTAGTYSWVAPSGVTSVAVVAVGGGGSSYGTDFYCYTWFAFNGGGGGGLGYKNGITVTPGNSYTVVVGAGGVSRGAAAGNSYFSSAGVVQGGSGAYTTTYNTRACGGTYTGDGGGNGGKGGSYTGGGGGAGGYSGNGGCGRYSSTNATAGAGGGGGGGGNGPVGPCTVAYGGGGGGGVGLLGQGSNGAAGTNTGTTNYGGGGSSGANGGGATRGTCYPSYNKGYGGVGGAYGGGAGANAVYPGNQTYIGANGGVGAVRIVWCSGGARGTPSFPSTNVGA